MDRRKRLVKWQLVVLGFPMTDKHIKQYLPRTKYESEAIVSLFWNILDTGGTVMAEEFAFQKTEGVYPNH
jgi:hypothetical protein